MLSRQGFLFVLTLALLGIVVPAFADSFTNLVDTSMLAPGGGTFSSFAVYPRINGHRVLIQATTAGGPSTALYLHDGMGLSRIAAAGETAPGANTTFAGIDLGSIASNGDVAFRASFSQAGFSRTGVWVRDGGGLRLVARYNQLIPNTTARFDGFSVPRITESGTVYFGASAQTDGTQTGLFRSDNGSVERIVRAGQAAPGGGAFSFSGFSAPSVQANASGQIAFHTSFQSGASNQAVYVGTPGSLARVAGTGDAAPGGGTFNLPLSVGIASDGTTLIWDNPTGGSGSTLFTAKDGILTRIIGGGDLAPGGGTLSGILPPTISDSGNLAFFGFSSTGGQSLYARDARGLRRVIALGEALFGSTVTSLSVPVGPITVNSSPSINDAGVVSFYYELADGRKGIALGTVSAPEPGSLPFLCLPALILVLPAARRLVKLRYLL